MKYLFFVLGGFIATGGAVITLVSFAGGVDIPQILLGLLFFFFGLFLIKCPKNRAKYLAEQKEKQEEVNQMCRHLEQARLEDLPTVEVPVQLQKNETCYLTAQVAWKEMRKATNSRKYKGVGFNIKLTKGVYYRVGNIKSVPNTNTELTTIDTGTLYFTDKRLIFSGNKGNKVIPLAKIFDITLYSDAIDIQKDTGKPASLFPTDGTPTKLMVSMISKLMQ